ncbi:hypothetical protein FYZ48_21535 [Gimesia chilikensis]|uniref:hypothetical protein n=1 Tax=Gimesia chilikensis TaxID=2605989 RepID=UPI0011EDE37E|nr:hypothetical protein [Gimesia chilikensis]KAA0134175.1 hypothetical protein FYZ48_21535 [Gimesia chilikensis]
MDRIALSLIAVLLIGFAVLLVTPQDQKSTSTQTVKLQRHTIELERVENVRVTPNGTLRFSHNNGNHLQQTQYFINLYAGNVTVIQDAEFARDRIQLTDTLVGGLQITLSRSHTLELDYLEAPYEAPVHNFSELFSEVSAHSH